MKKKIFITLMMCLALAIAGCGEKNKTPDTTPTPEVTPTATATPTDTPSPTPTVTPTFTPSPTPTPSPYPVIVTNESAGTTVTLKDYKGIKLASVTDKDVDNRIDEEIQKYITEVEVYRPAQMSDIVLIFFMGRIDGEFFEGGTYRENDGYELVLGSHTFIDDFEEQLVGAVKGEQRLVTVTFPDDYHVEEFRGKEAEFDVVVNHVMEYKIPELNDEFVQEHYLLNTVSEYKEMVRNNLNSSYYRQQILKYLHNNFPMENPPQDEIKTFADGMFEFYYRPAYEYATFIGTDISTVLYYYYGVFTEDQLKTLCQQAAEDNIYFQNVSKAIAILENIDITNDDYLTWLKNNLDIYGYETVEEFSAEYPYEVLYEDVLTDKIYDMILANAVIE